MGNDRLHTPGTNAKPSHVDGTFELTFGSMFLLAALLFWGTFKISSLHSFFSSNIFPVLTVVLFLGGGGVVDTLVKKIRKVIIQPRKSLLSLREQDALNRLVHNVIWIGIPMLTLALMGALFFSRATFHLLGGGAPTSFIPVFWGGLFSVLCYLVGRKIALKRFNLISMVSLATGAALFINGADGIIAMMILFGALGAACCLSGGLSLWQVLRNASVPGELV